MRAAVVYESMFGHTRDIAEAIALGLSIRDVEVDTLEVGSAAGLDLDRVDLLVVGAPTHALTLSRPESRASAAEQTDDPLVSEGPGLREWLAELPQAPRGRRAASFDTHVDKPIPGSAARAARRRLRRLGYRLVAPAESFYVGGTTGPLIEGEATRARAWGARLAADIGASGERGATTIDG